MADENTPTPPTPPTESASAAPKEKQKTQRQRMNVMLKIVENFKSLDEKDQAWVMAEIAKS